MLDCEVVRNISGGVGGGVTCYFGSQMTLTGCVIAGNATTLTNSSGGGVYCYQSSPIVENCTIHGNYADGPGSGVYCSAVDAFPIFRNCTITRNTPSGGVHAEVPGTPIVENCIVWENEPYDFCGSSVRAIVSYSSFRGVSSGVGNIQADPLFVDPDGPDNDPDTWEDNDYRLSAGSPCIDAGNPGFVAGWTAVDLDGNARLWDGDGDGLAIVDMGAYEFAAPPLQAACLGDANCDGVVSWRDIDVFVAAMNDNTVAWQAMFAPGAPTCAFANNDANADGTVNWRDIDPLVALMDTVCP
jgi:hypothetical protein